MLNKIDSLGFDTYFIDDKEKRFAKFQTGLDWRNFLPDFGHTNLFCVKKERSLSLCLFSHSAELAGAERSLLELVDSVTAKFGVICTVVLPNDGPLVQMLEDIGAATVIS